MPKALVYKVPVPIYYIYRVYPIYDIGSSVVFILFDYLYVLL